MTKIVKLEAENVKRLKAVSITPDGELVRITGRNGAGKTSVLDSIAYALGGQALVPSKPIRDGEKTARATVTLSNGLKVERRFTESGSVLDVRGPKGEKYPSPQSMINALMGDYTLDPLAFARAEPKEQFEMLRRLAGVDTSKIDEGLRRLEGERPALRAAMKREQTLLDGMPDDPEAPAERVDVRAALVELEKVRAHNATRENARRAREQAKARITHAEQEIARLQAQVAQDQEDLGRMPEVGEPRDETAIRARIDSAEELNARHAAAEKRREQAERVVEACAAFQFTEERIKRGREKRAETIAAATYPVPGLALGDGEVLFNEIPLSQASSAEQLRVSTAIAMASNPELRVLRIQDGSLLDSAGLATLAEMASESDYQIWIESVDESGKVGFYIEDGEVKS